MSKLSFHSSIIFRCQMQFVRQLLERGNTVHATARKPRDSPGLQELSSNKELSVETLDTSQPESIREWAKGLSGSRPFEASHGFSISLKILRPYTSNSSHYMLSSSVYTLKYSNFHTARQTPMHHLYLSGYSKQIFGVKECVREAQIIHSPCSVLQPSILRQRSKC